jgi:hypothetical protein
MCRCRRHVLLGVLHTIPTPLCIGGLAYLPVAEHPMVAGLGARGLPARAEPAIGGGLGRLGNLASAGVINL